MTTWTIDDLRKLDRQYAKQGLHLHQRPFRAAIDLLGPSFSMGVGGNPEVEKITAAYRAMIPEVSTSWPGMGIGLAISVDRVRKVVVPVIFGAGRPIQPWQALGFDSPEDWWTWCREDKAIGASTSFAVADLFDFAYGVDDFKGTKADAETLWTMAASNLSDLANALPSAFSVDSVIQSVCLIVELSLKAALVANGANPNGFKGPSGHDLVGLARRMAAEMPHRDDPLVELVVAKLPPYVASRYKPAGLTRLEVVELALGAQFVAASSVRRLSGRDLAAQMEAGGWPGPRLPFFS